MGWLDRFANLDSASGSEVPAFFSLTPAFSPLEHPALSAIKPFQRLSHADNTARQRSTGIDFDAKPLKRLTSISYGESPA